MYKHLILRTRQGNSKLLDEHSMPQQASLLELTVGWASIIIMRWEKYTESSEDP